MTPSVAHRNLFEALREGLRAALGANLHSAYAYGAAASDEAPPTGDIDYHAILNAPPDEDQKTALDKAFADLAGLEKEIQEARASGDREIMREKWMDFREKMRAAVEGVLTPEQMEQLRELMQRRMGRGGRGGRSGRGGDGG